MFMREQHQIQIALDGVVRLLSQNLYADPDVFLREMIQNAQDSIVKRRLREPHAGRIDLIPRTAAGTLTIEDDGIGLTREDIHAYLSTIGRSFDGGTSYELSLGDRDAVGTSVTLSLKPACRAYVEHARLAELVRRFAELVPIPITMAFYAWCDTARSHAAITYEAIAAVAEEAQRFLVATGRTAGRGRWRRSSAWLRRLSAELRRSGSFAASRFAPCGWPCSARRRTLPGRRTSAACRP